MAVSFRTTVTGTFATAASATITLNTGAATGDIQLAWVVVKTGTTIGTPSGGGGGWSLLASGDSGGVKAALFARTVPGGAGNSTVTLSPNTDGYIASVAWTSTATSPTLDYGQQGYTGTGTDPSDAGDTFTYSSRGKLDVDTTGDTTLGTFAGGKIAETDVALYFYAVAGVSVSGAPSLGGTDTSLGSSVLPTTSTVRGGVISSTFRVEVGRGFTLSQSNTSVAFGLWASENGAAPGGSGNLIGRVNGPPTVYATAIDIGVWDARIATSGLFVQTNNGTRPWAVDIDADANRSPQIQVGQASPEIKQGQQGGGIAVR